MSLPAPKLEARAEQEMDSFAQVQSRMSDDIAKEILEEMKKQKWSEKRWLDYIAAMYERMNNHLRQQIPTRPPPIPTNVS